MSFIQNTYIEITLVGALSGLVGLIACLRQRVFYTQALTHATFPGAILGVVLASKVLFEIYGINDTYKSYTLSLAIFIGAAIMCIPMMYFMNVISKIKGQGSKVAAGILLTVGFALGFLFMKLFKPLPLKIHSFISGNILTSNYLDILITGLALAVCVIIFSLHHKNIIFLCFDELGFHAQGKSVKKTDYIILFMITLTVVVTMPAVGSILSIALIVGPAAGSIKVCNSVYSAFILAPLLGIFTGIAGVYTGILLGISVGGMVTVFSVITYGICVLFSRLRKYV